MLAEQRHHYILTELDKHGALAVADIVRALAVSRETVRRDLNALAGRGLVTTTHGGALSVDRVDRADRGEPHVDVREGANAVAKQRIGARAAAFVSDGASLVIDSGSTTLALARALQNRQRLTVYTNDWRIAMALGRRNGNRVTVLGGELADLEDAAFGLDTVQQLSQYHADLAFIGAGGITADAHLTDYSRLAAEVRGRMIGAAACAIVVADASKFGAVTPVRIRGFEAVRYLITEKPPDSAIRRALAARGPELVVA